MAMERERERDTSDQSEIMLLNIVPICANNDNQRDNKIKNDSSEE